MRLILHLPLLKKNSFSFFPFIILPGSKLKNDSTLINHKSIHLRQQLELLIIPYYLIFASHYLVNLVISGNHTIAYKNILFEREAMDNDTNPSYLESRRAYSFINYL